MKFTSELIKKAYAVCKSIRKARPEYSFRFAWREAIRQTIRAFKALKKGTVEFIKLDGTVTKRNIALPTEVGYVAKSSKESGLFVFADLDKFVSGDQNYIISCHGFQIVG
jgi:hypothetical protein